MGDAVLLTVEVWAVHLVEEQVELRRLGLHRGAAVQSHAHLGENFSRRTLSRKKNLCPGKAPAFGGGGRHRNCQRTLFGKHIFWINEVTSPRRQTVFCRGEMDA